MDIRAEGIDFSIAALIGQDMVSDCKKNEKSILFISYNIFNADVFLFTH